MKGLDFGRFALTIGVAAALLAGCGGSQPPITSDGVATPSVLTKSKTFHYTGDEQLFRVPNGIHFVTISATGADGGGRFGGYPGRVRATVPVTAGETLAVFVGGDAARGGFNGGGAGTGGSCHHCNGVGGGGASDVREHGAGLADRVVVAGGGGGTGGYLWNYGRGSANGTGGVGGGQIAGQGGQNSGGGGGGAGGTQQSGGAGGAGCARYSDGAGTDGSLGLGGAGGIQSGTGGGGGGGGYYGGGGGGSAGYGCSSSGDGYPTGGGGGGGSSYIEPNAKTIHNYQGYQWSGGGIVVIQW